MKITRSWLRSHLNTDADARTLCDTLTDIGLEVEKLRDPAADLAPFTIARVLEARLHPNADRLRVCLVETGATGKDDPVQVVCGAPNARTGMMGVFAPAGSHIPGTGVALKAGVIRGEASNGMLLSERELGLSDEHEGIIDLPDTAPLGASFAAWAGLDDPEIEIGITPNRGDCLGVRGIARDLAARGLGSLVPYDFSEVAGDYPSPLAWRRADDVGGACPYVVGRHFRGLGNGPSPDWLQRRLTSIGLRPISALVDITNFVTFDLGRPLHVFDAATLKGAALTMRPAREGECVAALDGKEYRLKAGMTVIADESGAQAIGGIIGGVATGCEVQTTEAFLESALFDPVHTATTGRALGIESDARYRFERGVDPNSADWGAAVATRLILEICGGTCSTLTRAGVVPDDARSIALRLAKLASFGGITMEAGEAADILHRLGFTTESAGENTLRATPPSWRGDIAHEHCLIEEILRIKGFAAVPACSLPRVRALPRPVLTVLQRRQGFARRILAMRGMQEAVTWSFMASSAAADFDAKPTDGAKTADEAADGMILPILANPLTADLDRLRPSILPNLIAACGRNDARGRGDVALFEIGPVFRHGGEGGQDLVIAGVRAGRTGPRHWDARGRAADLFDAKADVLAVLDGCGVPTDKVQTSVDAPSFYHPGRSGCLRLGPTVLARFGELHPDILAARGVRGTAAGFEVFLEHLPQAKAGKRAERRRPALKPVALQPLTRDFAFLAPVETPVDGIVRAALGTDRSLIDRVSVFDVYQDESTGEEKSVAISVTLQPTDKTLTDAEIEAVAGRIVANVAKRTGARLRTATGG